MAMAGISARDAYASHMREMGDNGGVAPVVPQISSQCEAW